MPIKRSTDHRRLRKVYRDFTNDYYAALGRFVDAFARVETTLLRVLWTFAQLKSPYAQAVLSGVRIEGAMGLINRIADAESWKPERRQDWQKIFTQIGIINKLRNDIFHHGTAWFGQVWVVSNRDVAHLPERVREIHITPKILDKATKDLWDIFVFLTLLGGPAVGEIYGRKSPTLMRQLRRKPWRYKQPPQADAARTLRQIRQKPRRPRPPSRA